MGRNCLPDAVTFNPNARVGEDHINSGLGARLSAFGSRSSALGDERTALMNYPGMFRVHSVGSASLSIVLRPRGGDWLEDEIRALKTAGVQLLVSMLTPDEQAELDLSAEAACCSALGMEYLSVPIPDLGVPTDSASFENAIKKVISALQRGQSVAVHCRQSIGRSGMFTCAVLVALGLPVEKAIATASEARGLAVPETPQQRMWLVAHAYMFARSLRDPRKSAR
jgi:protein-tyrosine phosphatase